MLSAARSIQPTGALSQVGFEFSESRYKDSHPGCPSSRITLVATRNPGMLDNDDEQGFHFVNCRRGG